MDDTAPVTEDEDSFEQDTGSLKWVTLNVTGTPPSSRSGHSLTVLNNYAFCYGGSNEDSTEPQPDEHAVA